MSSPRSTMGEEPQIEIDRGSPTSSPRRRSSRLGDGTTQLAAGTAAAGLASLAYLAVGARQLGAYGFSPLATLLAVHLLVAAAALIPVELLGLRLAALGRGGDLDRTDRRSARTAALLGVAGMVVFVALTLPRVFGSRPAYLGLAAAVIATHAIFALARGTMLGHGRYTEWAFAGPAAALLRLALALAVLSLEDALPLVTALAAAPLLVLAWRPFRHRRPSHRVRPRPGSGALLTSFAFSRAAPEVLLVAAPLVAGALAAGSGKGLTTVSLAFLLVALARSPLVLTQTLAAPTLGRLTARIAEGDRSEPTRRARLLAGGALAGGALGAVVGLVLLPPLASWLFGPAFRPEPAAAALAAAAGGMAAGAVLLNQVLVAFGATGKLAAVWTVALGVALVTAVVLGGSPTRRVLGAATAGELAAVLASLLAVQMALPESPDSAYDLLKRAFDLVAGGLLLVVTMPLQLVLGLAVRLDSPGPVFFLQERVGKNDRPFTIVKFRSMIAGASEEPLYRHLQRVARQGYVRPETTGAGPSLWIDDETRITRVGRFLRKTSLDELPNLWNVVRGHMSLVGPRPLVPAEVELLGPQARARSRVRPGVTGLAQVRGGSEITFAERAHWDLHYVEHRSLLLDLRILLGTPLLALRRPDHTKEG